MFFLQSYMLHLKNTKIHLFGYKMLNIWPTDVYIFIHGCILQSTESFTFCCRTYIFAYFLKVLEMDIFLLRKIS